MMTERGPVWEHCALTRITKNKSIMKALAQVKGWLQDWTGKESIEVELNGSERVQQVAVDGVTVPCLAYVGESCVSVCAYNDGDANALLRCAVDNCTPWPLLTINFTDIMTKNERRSAHINSIAMRYGGFKCCQNDLTKVWRSWRRMECKLHNLLESENSKNYERVREEAERLEESLRNRITGLFRDSSKCSGELFFNHDVRGHSIKFDVPRDERVAGMVCDWGEYVILAPDELL